VKSLPEALTHVIGGVAGRLQRVIGECLLGEAKVRQLEDRIWL